MTDADRAEFANAMDETALVLGTPRPTEAKKLAFWDILKEYDLDVVLVAFNRCQRVSTRYPVPAAVLEQVSMTLEEQSRKSEMSQDSKISEWERDRRLHPDEYYKPEEIPGVMRAIFDRLGWSGPKPVK